MESIVGFYVYISSCDVAISTKITQNTMQVAWMISFSRVQYLHFYRKNEDF